MFVFEDHWRACLREHYKYVVQSNDAVTRASLTHVMLDVGFRDEELRQLELEATIRADDVPDDFVPNLDILQPAAPSIEEDAFQPHPLECQCPACLEMNLRPHDEEGQPIETDAEEMPEHPRKPKEDPKQLSLF